MLKAAIYHFTEGKEKRPKIYLDQLNLLEEYAITLGYTVSDIFFDKSSLRCERPEFTRFLSSCDQYDALITKDFYHISKNSLKCISIINELRVKGVTIYTTENGHFAWDEAPFNKQLRVATYNCRFGNSDEMKQIITIQNDVLSLFSNKKTNWTIVDQYFDESKYQKDGEQVQLKKLIDNRNLYDLILVHNLNDIHWRTANLCKIREQIQLDIYSLQEGFLKYTHREESI